ncbi:uncharacterized protein ACN427_007846 isoform 2-T4 [Glossina fuscipes fuscipes]
MREMGSQGVTEVYRFTKLNDDGKTRSPKGRIILSFDRYRLPATVDVAWYKCKVELYIPNPKRCKNCQRLGHTAKRCSSPPSCANCGLPPHPENCTRSFCLNYNDQHSALDKQCPRFIHMREILKIKTVNYCSMGEARCKYREINPSGSQRISKSNTYAVVASQIVSNKPLTPTSSNEKPVLPSIKNYIAKPVPLPAKDNIEKIKTTAHIEKTKTTTHKPKSNNRNPPESPVLNSTQQSTSCNESNLSSLNEPSISNYSRVPTRGGSNIHRHLSTDYSAGLPMSF